jgi:hypothetical protein
VVERVRLENSYFYFVDLDVQFENVTYTVDESVSSLDVVVNLLASIERVITLELMTVDGRASAGNGDNHK